MSRLRPYTTGFRRFWCNLMHRDRFLIYYDSNLDGKSCYCQRCGCHWLQPHKPLPTHNLGWIRRLRRKPHKDRLSWRLSREPYEDRCIGTLLGVACGDILGANVETLSREEILTRHGRVTSFLHSETRPFGHYTDDTEQTIALATSLNHCQGLNVAHCAANYAKYYAMDPTRGYGRGTRQAMEALNRGADYRFTGRIESPEGSFTNGGAMRISPVGLVFRNAINDELYAAVRLALLPTHVHPEGVDGAWIQAKAIAILCQSKAEDIHADKFLTALQHASKTEPMYKKLAAVRTLLKEGRSHEEMLHVVCAPDKSGRIFQRPATEAVACALWCFARYLTTPEEAIIQAVSLGGDTDTIASLVGAQMGALHGTPWIPLRWFAKIENRPSNGRDTIIQTAKELAGLDLRRCSR